MHCVLNTVTAVVLFVGSKPECEVYVEKHMLTGYYKIMRVLDIEGEIIPYDEHISSRSESFTKC